MVSALSRKFEWLMTVTEVGMLAYWVLAAALVMGNIYIPPEYMYSDYQNPLIVVWNWSFFPIDVGFAICGLLARFAPLHPDTALRLSVIGATLMLCAGGMAISFWSILGEFDALWWGLNIWLILLGGFALFQLMRRR